MAFKINSLEELKKQIGKALIQFKNEDVEPTVNEIITLFSYLSEEGKKSVKENRDITVNFSEAVSSKRENPKDWMIDEMPTLSKSVNEGLIELKTKV
jgi:cytoplasmic iron level regulating protein YaaA (DUF328/UPF0246 family)